MRERRGKSQTKVKYSFTRGRGVEAPVALHDIYETPLQTGDWVVHRFTNIVLNIRPQVWLL